MGEDGDIEGWAQTTEVIIKGQFSFEGVKKIEGGVFFEVDAVPWSSWWSERNECAHILIYITVSIEIAVLEFEDIC